MPGKFCMNCGAALTPESLFCLNCGEKVTKLQEKPTEDQTVHSSAVPTNIQKQPAQPKPQVDSAAVTSAVLSATAQLFGNTSVALSSGGEMAFTQTIPSVGKTLTATLGPLKYLLNGVLGLFKGFQAAIKDKKKLIPAIVLAAIWFLFTLLPALGINPHPVKLLSFLTFAQGGVGTGIWGTIGGIVGKGVFAYFITLMIPTSGNKPISGIGKGLKSLFSSLTAKGKGTAAPLLLGMGTSLIAYHFMTGNASLQNSMAGIAAFILSLRAMSGKVSFIQGFILSVGQKLRKGKAPDISLVNRVMAGCTTGFALGVALSAAHFGFICSVGGVLAIIAAIIFFLVGKSKKGVAAT